MAGDLSRMRILSVPYVTPSHTLCASMIELVDMRLEKYIF